MSEERGEAQTVAPGRAAGPRLREALAFVALALGFSAAYGALVWASRRGLLAFDMGGSTAGTVAKLLLRDLGPACAAVVCAAALGGGRALRALWATTTRWRAPGWLWLLALLGPFVVVSPVVLVGLLTGTLQRATEPVSPLRLLVVFLAMAIFDGPLGEEIGWRGYLLPRLLDRIGPLAASGAVGVVWWLWHVPLYLADGRGLGLADWATYLATTLALSAVFTWFYLRSGGSTLMAILLHDTSNFAVYLFFLTLWVRVGESPVPKLAHAVVVLAAGGAAAVALYRSRGGGAA
jgi:membrane protease YdiL (CAAX protease family)